MRSIVLALFWLATRPAVAASCTAITAKGDCQTSAACEWHAASLSCIKKLTALRDDDDAADDGDDAGTTLLDDVADDALDDDATDGCGSLGCNWTNPKDGNSTTARVWLRCGAHNRTRGECEAAATAESSSVESGAGCDAPAAVFTRQVNGQRQRDEPAQVALPAQPPGTRVAARGGGGTRRERRLRNRGP